MTVSKERSYLRLAKRMILDDWGEDKTPLPVEKMKKSIQNTIDAICRVSEKSFDDLQKDCPGLVEKITNFALESRSVKTYAPNSLSARDEKTKEENLFLLRQNKTDEEQKHWTAYQEYLSFDKMRTPDTIEHLNEVTDSILSHFPDISQEDKFLVSGLVVGYVQSGKTENYLALINKLIDFGVDIFIILAGTSSLLRNQTQKRSESDILGMYSHSTEKIGIGNHLEGEASVEFFTNQDKKRTTDTRGHNGDVSRERIDNLPAYLGNKQIVLVVKKHKDVLAQLIEWLERASGIINGEKTGQDCLEGKTLILIDDEADHASINIGRPDKEDSAIFSHISKILNLFDKKAIIGYTATPFANIFSAPGEANPLFPKDFIYSLKAPSDYMGIFELFGKSSEENKKLIELFGKSSKENEKPNYPLVRSIDKIDETSNPEDKRRLHDWDFKKDGLISSMKEAIHAFLLSGAIRNLRGDGNEPHSMLIHFDVRIASHASVQAAVQQYLNDLKASLTNGETNEDFWEKDFGKDILRLWTWDFRPTSEKMEKLDSEHLYDNEVLPYEMNYAFEEVKEALMSFLDEMAHVYKINGDKEADFINYEGYKVEQGKPLKVICVGGSILGRGFTVEGLACTYYGRGSLQADTIMQGGRFFGYRPGYRDLVRIYVTKDIQTGLTRTAEVLSSLLKQFEDMMKENKKPQDFGFCVKNVIRLTSNKRIRNAEIVRSSFSGYTSEVATFLLNDNVSKENHEITENFIMDLGRPSVLDGTKPNEEYSWRFVDSNKVLDYLAKMKIASYSRLRSVTMLQDYVKEVREEYGELFYFDVILINQDSKGEVVKFGEYKVKAGQRKAEWIDGDKRYYTINQGRALTGRHLEYGLTTKEKQKLKEKYPLKKSSAVRKLSEVREFRPERAQLLIYTFSAGSINDSLELEGDEQIKETPIGFSINIPYCESYADRESVVQKVSDISEALRGTRV